jgi:hypothetical protein
VVVERMTTLDWAIAAGDPASRPEMTSQSATIVRAFMKLIGFTMHAAAYRLVRA